MRIVVRLSASAAGLTSLKRFQCFILRLYCEMVDSHCSSSMKFPVFSASLTLFKSVWKAESASTTSGTRRHARSVISTMAADGKNILNSGCCRVSLPLLRGGGCSGGVWKYQVISLRERERERERERGREGKRKARGAELGRESVRKMVKLVNAFCQCNRFNSCQFDPGLQIKLSRP